MPHSFGTTQSLTLTLSRPFAFAAAHRIAATSFDGATSAKAGSSDSCFVRKALSFRKSGSSIDRSHVLSTLTFAAGSLTIVPAPTACDKPSIS
jgi:hypothetical protein